MPVRWCLTSRSTCVVVQEPPKSCQLWLELGFSDRQGCFQSWRLCPLGVGAPGCARGPPWQGNTGVEAAVQAATCPLTSLPPHLRQGGG